ncbi:MAG TPA: hypothetical protein VHV47_12665, partial [Opitutaceae bacterium]|nr:hypothetical protein [Opitutaceae bacterium]
MRALRLLSWTAVAAVLALLLWRNWYGPDIWYHLYLGGRIAETGSAQPADQLILRQPGFLNFYWLFQLAVRGAWALGGRGAVSAFLGAAWTAALLCWLATAGLLRRGPWAPLLALAALMICQMRFEPRPEVFSYLFLALQIRWLAAWPEDRMPAGGNFARFAAVQVLWSNLHGYFALGPFLVILRLAAVRSKTGARSLGLLLGLAFLASVASPFGWRNWAAVAA